MLDTQTVELAVTTETRPGERRVALVPDVVKKLVSAGWEVCVQAGAGTEAAFSDGAYTEAGATVAPGRRVDARRRRVGGAGQPAERRRRGGGAPGRRAAELFRGGAGRGRRAHA